ncbi:MAG: pyridoxamine 5'-phosphate oxidase family protein [Acidobacteriota bacterium]|nr:pyridoxamine 5'-phosphate oxidase family protein [Acidobacteriota bacterium]
MGQGFAKTMFSDAAKRLQERYGSRAAYQRLAGKGESRDALGPMEQDFIARRDSFYLASVTVDGWPYVQHRGGPKGFLRVLDDQTLAFADFAGNKQYITAGNLETNDRVMLFLMDYPNQARLKMIGHAKWVEGDAELLAKVRVEGYKAKVERVMVVDVVGFDWNCSQHITERWTAEEIEAVRAGK